MAYYLATVAQTHSFLFRFTVVDVIGKSKSSGSYTCRHKWPRVIC